MVPLSCSTIKEGDYLEVRILMVPGANADSVHKCGEHSVKSNVNLRLRTYSIIHGASQYISVYLVILTDLSFIPVVKMEKKPVKKKSSKPNSTSSRYFTNSTATRSSTPSSSHTSTGRRQQKGPAPNATPKRHQQAYSSANSISTSTPALTQSEIGTSLSRPTTASGRKSRATSASSVLGVGEAHTIVCAVCEARGVSPSVGIAFVNTSLGEVVLSQICDNQSYVKTLHKIRINAPARIVCLAQSTQGTKSSNLMPLLRAMFFDTPIDETDRSCWSEEQGKDYIHKLAFETDIQPIEVALQGKYYALCALAAVRMQHQNQNKSCSYF